MFPWIGITSLLKFCYCSRICYNITWCAIEAVYTTSDDSIPSSYKTPILRQSKYTTNSRGKCDSFTVIKTTTKTTTKGITFTILHTTFSDTHELHELDQELDLLIRFNRLHASSPSNNGNRSFDHHQRVFPHFHDFSIFVCRTLVVWIAYPST